MSTEISFNIPLLMSYTYAILIYLLRCFTKVKISGKWCHSPCCFYAHLVGTYHRRKRTACLNDSVTCTLKFSSSKSKKFLYKHDIWCIFLCYFSFKWFAMLYEWSHWNIVFNLENYFCTFDLKGSTPSNLVWFHEKSLLRRKDLTLSP